MLSFDIASPETYVKLLLITLEGGLEIVLIASSISPSNSISSSSSMAGGTSITSPLRILSMAT